MPDQIYVTGHVNPDTDSIASAMGYAWLFRERDGANTIAARIFAVVDVWDADEPDIR